MATLKYTLLIPLNYNDGTRVPRNVMRAIYTDLFALAGGYSTVGKAKGAFRMADGSKKIDESNIVWVAIDEDNEDRLKQLVADMARRLGQERVYFEKSGGTVEFIPPLDSGDES